MVFCASSSLVVLAACDNDENNPTGTGGSSSRLVFASSRDDPVTFELDLYSVNADGSDLRRLTLSPGDDAEPTWSTKGRIAFTSSRDGNNEIYSMNADGTGQTRLTNDPGEDYQPNWSPDGTQILWTSYRTGKPDIWEIYRNDKLERMGVDVDGDEHVDRWDHDTDLRRKLDEEDRKKEEEAAAAAAKKAQEQREKNEKEDLQDAKDPSKKPPAKKTPPPTK